MARLGGVGFIGFHAASALLERGHDVAILDDYSDAPYPVRYKERNAIDLAARFPNVTIVRGTVCDRETVRGAMAGADAVLHLAGLAGVRPSFRDPAAYARVNVEGTAVMLEEARARGIARFVFASSSSVYGDSTPLPAREDAPAIEPRSPYAASKRAAELVASAITLGAPSMACSALRFFTVYGARQRPEMAITLFTRALLAGRTVTMYGDGSMRRDFTHVSDIVRGVLAACDRAESGFRAYNLGSEAPITLKALVEAIGRACGVVPRIEHAPAPLGDVEATFADGERARRELGWTPRVPLEAGLETVVDWVKKND